MAYTIPQFPLTCSIFTGGADVGSPPRAASPCNLAYGRRVPVQFADLAAAGEPAIWACLLLPCGTDVRDFASTTGRDTVEVPAGSGRFFRVDYVDDLGLGFPNEHRFALLQKLIPWPTPLPGCPAAPVAEVCQLAAAVGGGVGHGLTVKMPFLLQSGRFTAQDATLADVWWTDVVGPDCGGAGPRMDLRLTGPPPRFVQVAACGLDFLVDGPLQGVWFVPADSPIFPSTQVDVWSVGMPTVTVRRLGPTGPRPGRR